LHHRVAIFLKEAKMCGLITNKYHGGYFVSIPYDNPEILNQKLVENKIYTIPFYKCVRIAISNIPTQEVKGLAKRIHKVLLTLK
jgi:aromatic-amino-acid transaminase